MTLIRATLNPDGTIFIEDNHSTQLIQGRIDPLRVDQTSDDDINLHIIADMAAVQQDATVESGSILKRDNHPSVEERADNQEDMGSFLGC